MQIWLWVISGVMWFVSTGLTGIGIWKLFNSFNILRQAELNFIVSQLEGARVRLADVPRKFRAKPEELTEVNDFLRVVDNLERNLDKQLKMVYELGGEAGATGKLEEISATKSIALAAAFFAMAGIVVGGSALLIAVFSG